MMVLSIAAVVALVTLGAQLQIPTAFAFPKARMAHVFPFPNLTSQNPVPLGSNTCIGSGCHTNSGSPGSAAITGFPTGMTYTPGTPIPLTVTVNDTTRSTYGFELTARLASNTATAAGTFTPGSSSNLGTNGVQVIQGTSGSPSFSFTWNPPATASGTVNFYLTAIATNSTGNNGAYTAMYALSAAAPTPPADFSLSASPTSVTITDGGASGSSTVTVTKLNGFNSSVAFTASGQPSGVTASFSGGTLTLTASSTATTGTFPVTITGTSTSPSLSHTTTVNLTVNAAPAPSSNISASPAMLTFNYQQGSAAPASQQIMVSGSPAGLAYTAAASTTSGGTWLSVGSTSGTVAGTINVTATPGTLLPNTYTGQVMISSTGATGSPQMVSVRLVITSATTTSSLTSTPTSLHFSYQSGGTAPPSQNLSIGATGSTKLNFTASYSGGTWVTLKPTTGTTPGMVSVTATPGTMSSGTYNGTITISATGATTLNVPVILTVTGTGGGGTYGSMYAQPHVHYGTSTSSSGGLAALWVNGVGDSSQYNHQGLVLSMSASEPAGSWVGAYIQNVTGISLTELGFDIRDGSQCTATSPRFIVVMTDASSHVVGACSTGPIQTGATPTNVPVGWKRVRFNQTLLDQATPTAITAGMKVQSITLVMDQAPESAAGALGGFAVIDNIDVNGTLITGGTNYSHDD
jgi:hypothetical protein